MTTVATWRPAKPGETPGQLSPECTNGYPEACTDPQCTAPEHLPEKDVVWSEAMEDAAWLWDDDRFRRRCDV